MRTRLGELGQRFLERSAKDIVTSRELIEQVGQRRPALDDLIALVHKMNGAGLTLGFPEISAQAQPLERYALSLTKQAIIGAKELASLREHAVRVEQAIDQAIRARAAV